MNNIVKLVSSVSAWSHQNPNTCSDLNRADNQAMVQAPNESDNRVIVEGRFQKRTITITSYLSHDGSLDR